MELTIHRYNLRPGLTTYPIKFPNDYSVYVLNEDITLNYDWTVDEVDINSDNFDLDAFIVLDEEWGQPYTPFYDCVDGANPINEYVVKTIQKYNDFMDNINWLVRNKSKEKILTFNIKEEEQQPQMSLYEINQQTYASMSKPSREKLRKLTKVLANYITKECSNYKHKHFLLLCKELSDYTFFTKQLRQKCEESSKLVIEILKSRGEVLDICYNKDGNYVECWIMYADDNKPHMYVFFEADDFNVEF